MSKTQYDVDICIIGAGSAGLSVASGAAQLGRSVVLFEAEKMGGDCLNYGCVPSKALIAAGKHAHAFSSGKVFGVQTAEPVVNFETVKAHVQGVIDFIAPVDSQERFEGLGCTVIREYASFKDENTVHSATTEVKAKRIIVAVGSRASAPPIPGLAEMPYLTNENIFSIEKQPKKLLVIGAGPIGLELGQAFKRLGSEVEIIDIAAPLGRSEPEHAKVLVNALKEEGVVFHTPAKTKLIRKTKTGVAIDLEDGTTLTGSHLLVAAGRAPNVDKLDLEKAGIDFDRRGTTKKGKILGGSIVGEGAGEIIHMLSVAMTNNIKISGLAQIISPYPTRSEAVKRAASSWYTDALFSDRTRKIAGFLAKFH